MYVFEKLHLPGLLQRVDTTTMGASVEARVPFVDHKLVELSFRIDKELKLRWHNGPVEKIGSDSSEVDDTPKWVLKQASMGLLPSSVINRKKVGFPVPLSKWMDGDFSDIAKKKILSGSMVKHGIIMKSGLEELLFLESTSNQEAMLIWMLYNLEVFLEIHENNISI